jgi:hypothetical protein
VALHSLRRGRWRAARSYFLLLIAAWFVCSGVAELIVSGMETWRLLWGAPSAASFALWRGRADAALGVATVLLLLCLIAYPLLRRLPVTSHRESRIS